MGGQVVDTQSAEEFMRETLETVSRDELTLVAALLDTKAAGFAQLLGRRAGPLPGPGRPPARPAQHLRHPAQGRRQNRSRVSGKIDHHPHRKRRSGR